MVPLDSARRGRPGADPASVFAGSGIAATLAANEAHDLGHGPIGAADAACRPSPW
jgi:hypothetical protein